MKTLILIRHAKSDWNTASLIKDIDRPLNVRGVNDASVMADRLKKKKIKPDAIVSSIGIRALHTATIFCRDMEIASEKIQIKTELYHAGKRTIVDVIQKLDNKLDTVFVFCHNPGINDFAATFVNGFAENVPTTGTLAFKLESKKWEDFAPEKVKLMFFDYPKKK